MVVIVGILAVVAVGRMGYGTLGDFTARAEAKRLAVDLLQARRRSISTGENHSLDFTGSPATGYTLIRRAAGGDVAVDEPYIFSDAVVVTVSATEAEFNFEGQALAAYQITLTGPDQTWQVDVVVATGTAKVTQSGG